MREHYNVTINDNLDMIKKLKREVVSLKEQERRDKTILYELRKQNNNIIVPLARNKKEIQRLDKDLVTFNNQKRILDALKQKLHREEEELNGIKWNHEVLFQKLQALEKERDGFKQKFQNSIYSAQQRTNFQNLLLERKLSQLSMVGEKNTAAMAEIFRRANIDLETLDQSKVCISDVINEKTDQIALLSQKLKRIKDAHSKMRERHSSLVEKYSSNKATLNNKRSIVTIA